MTKTGKIVVLALGIIIVGVIFILINPKPTIAPIEESLITNFEECKNAGYPIMESYPEQCRTPGGNLFVRIIENDENPIDPNPNPNSGSKVAAGNIAGNVTIGPNCPVEQEGKPCLTPPEAYSSREVIVYESNGTTIIERGKIDSKGNFNIAISPGSYFVQIQPAGIGPGEKKSVTVKSFETTTVNFDIDTGIR